ncbi:Protein phosphatase 1 regulatory subunit 12B [Pteropus alecto]|uniref:Protein phosphatase 1 regulatory subunit 12B n=1 Tax=Pteropus alecto TaxID=9402 RepID=L5KXW7_PTEAL|nr:Protein phosphatase 1 regulatory subunit 12B [Pteropus alecto]
MGSQSCGASQGFGSVKADGRDASGPGRADVPQAGQRVRTLAPPTRLPLDLELALTQSRGRRPGIGRQVFTVTFHQLKLQDGERGHRRVQSPSAARWEAAAMSRSGAGRVCVCAEEPGARGSTHHPTRVQKLESAASNPATSDPYADRASARARREAREARLASLTSRVEEGSSRDYRKLYESALTENQKLKAQLQEAQLELADVQSRLEKVAQRQEKTSDRSSMLEVEKREKRALERKMSEMEEEMKVLTELKSDNQRLKDENGALIRVISKLSK